MASHTVTTYSGRTFKVLIEKPYLHFLQDKETVDSILKALDTCDYPPTCVIAVSFEPHPDNSEVCVMMLNPMVQEACIGEESVEQSASKSCVDPNSGSDAERNVTPHESPVAKKMCQVPTPKAMKKLRENCASSSARKLIDDCDIDNDDLGVSTITVTEEDTSFVAIKNLPADWRKFHENVLRASILRGMVDSLFCSEEEEIIHSFHDYNADHHTVTVEFINSEFAKLSSFLTACKCDDKILEFKLLWQHKPTSSKINETSKKNAYLDNDKVDEDVDPDYTPLDEDVDLFPTSDEPISLNSKRGTEIFIRNLVRLKSAFQANNHTAAFTRLQADLETDEKLTDCSMKKLQGKRRYLLNEFTKRVEAGDEEWIYFKPMSVVKGTLNEKVLLGTPFDPLKCPSTIHNESPLYQLAKYSKGATWTEPSIEALVKAYIPLKKSFESEPKKHSHLWNRIHLSLKNEGYYFQPQQCERQMQQLKKEFRDEADRVSATGGEGPSAVEEWPHYELMYPVMRDDVTVSPLFTISAGMRKSVSIHKAGISSGSVLPNLPSPVGTSDANQSAGIKVNRSSTRPSPTSLKERSVAAMESVALALDRKMKIAEKLLELKGNP